MRLARGRTLRAVLWMAVIATQLGCRLSALSPASAARLHDSRWTIEQAPASPLPADGTAPVVPMRERPEIVAASRTPPDAFGVPTGLYALDPLLAAHRRELDLRTVSARASATSMFIVAGVYTALAAACFALTPYAYHHAASPGAAVGFLAAGGGIFAIQAGGSFAAAGSLRGDADSRALERYYLETYKPAP